MVYDNVKYKNKNKCIHYHTFFKTFITSYNASILRKLN